jgi:imidazoleglycerol-phosphate dehydratase
MADITRRTAETDITLKLNLDGTGACDIDTGVGFLDHMLTLFAAHGRFDLTVKCEGDTEVDDHHTVEDVGICLGQAFAIALGDKRGICRYGQTILPMDEALILTAADLSGRAYLGYALEIPTEKVGTFDTELVKEFFLAFVRKSEITLHIKKLDGENAHHIVEGIFKAFAHTLRKATAKNEALQGGVLSTKGVL